MRCLFVSILFIGLCAMSLGATETDKQFTTQEKSASFRHLQLLLHELLARMPESDSAMKQASSCLTSEWSQVDRQPALLSSVAHYFRAHRGCERLYHQYGGRLQYLPVTIASEPYPQCYWLPVPVDAIIDFLTDYDEEPNVDTDVDWDRLIDFDPLETPDCGEVDWNDSE